MKTKENQITVKKWLKGGVLVTAFSLSVSCMSVPVWAANTQDVVAESSSQESVWAEDTLPDGSVTEGTVTDGTLPEDTVTDSTKPNDTKNDTDKVPDKKPAKKEGSIITKKGKKYYKKADGTLAKNKFVTVGNKVYYFDKKGVMKTGWVKRSGKYYYMSRSTGAQRKDCTVDGIRIKKDGTAKITDYSKSKIETMITARKIMEDNTKVSDSKEQKLKKMFDWVLKHPYKRYRRLGEVRGNKGWEMVFANDVYKKGNGCCVSEACAFAFLANECGYTAYVCDDTGHAWTEIDGHVYDTLFAEAKNYNDYYNTTYTKAKLHRSNKLEI